MNPGDKLYTVLFPIDSVDAQQGEATVTKVTEKRVYLEHKKLGALGPYEARPFSLRQVNYLPLFEGGVGGGFPTTLAAIRGALVFLHEEAEELQSKLELNQRRRVQLEKLRKEAFDKEVSPWVEILEAHPTRCQATAEAAQCLLAIGHDGDHDFRPDLTEVQHKALATAAGWSAADDSDLERR